MSFEALRSPGRLQQLSQLRAGTATRLGKSTDTSSLLVGFDFDFSDEFRERDLNYTVAAVQLHAQQLAKAAQEAIQAANQFKPIGANIAARDDYLRACFLDQAAANLGGSGGQIAQNALAALQQIHNVQVATWTKEQPKLAARLDLVIRDRSITEAIEQLAAATGLPIKVAPGSIEDAAALANNDIRVSYLDLRGATVAQALDWLLLPARLGDAILAGADRRLSGQSAWVYDVSQIALPSTEELKDLNNAKLVAAMKEAADGFLAVARAELAANEKLSVVWFAPGQLLVFGDLDRHKRAATLLAKLSTVEDGGLQGKSAELQKTTAKRAEQRQDFVTKLSAARRLGRVAAAHANFGWQLLAAAAGGKLDDEAFTELKIAWKDSATNELLASKSRSLAMRSLWIITESSNALPEEQELHALANSAAAKSEPFLEEMFKQVTENEKDTEAYAALLYGALAMRSDPAVRTRALELLTKADSDSSLAPIRVLAESLLADHDNVNDTLSKLVTAGVSGEDMIALTALACRRVGGDAWRTFRTESRDLLSSQPLSGYIVVLVDHLARQQLSLTQ
jgi:hypothetical protein